MTLVDKLFIDNCNEILASPYSDVGLPVRPKWADGTPAHTRKCFGIVNRYDLRKEFPIMTLRRVFWKTALKEVIWIYQKKSNVIAELGSNIWDSWDVGDGTIGKAYGYQIAQPTTYGDGTFDQMDRVLHLLKTAPMTRNIITTTYIPGDLPEMGLAPCAYSMTYNVTRNESTGKMTLNAILNQRSQDFLTANNWNVVQYALLLMMVAQSVDMEAGELVHVIADAHIYDRHEDMVRQLIDIPPCGLDKWESYGLKAPTVTLNPDITNFYDFTADSVIMEHYEYDNTHYDIPVAI